MEQLRENGISSRAVYAFFEQIKKQHVDLHSFSIYRNGKTIFSRYGYPYTKESMHRMYSSGKMLVALAVLKAVDEKKLRLTDKVLSFFKGELPDDIDPKYRELTVKHMLTMNTGHGYDTMMPMRQSANWISGFFSQPLDKHPGTLFFYNNGVPYILTKVVQKVTGLDYLDYLKEKFFREMDVVVIGDKTTQNDTDPSGISIRICDFEKLPMLLLQHGEWNGKQLIAPEIIDQMGMYHTSSIQCESVQNVNLDTKYGYGFFLWRNSVGGYRLDGGRGQYGFVFPDLHMCVSMMASEEDQGLIPELFWKYVYPYVWSGEAPDWTACDRQPDYKALPEWNQIDDDLTEVQNCTYTFGENSLHMDKVSFHVGKGVLQVKFVQNRKDYIVYAGADGKERKNEEMIQMPEFNRFMDHVTGNTDHTYYVVGKYQRAADFMANKEIKLFIRNLDQTVYDIISFRIANHAIRMELAHGPWNCVKLRGRLEILPHIAPPIIITGRKEE